MIMIALNPMDHHPPLAGQKDEQVQPADVELAFQHSSEPVVSVLRKDYEHQVSIPAYDEHYMLPPLAWKQVETALANHPS